MGATAENVEHENVLQLQYGGEWTADSYLSPLLYDGQYIGLGNEWWQDFQRLENKELKNGCTGKWLHLGKADVKGGRSYSERGNNYIYNLGFRGGWGALYNWQWDTGAMKGTDGSTLELMVGPYLDVDFMIREMGNNVNKPVSLDGGIDVDAMAGISWAFRYRSTGYRMRYIVRTNILGMEWLPDYWTSYYEVSEGVNTEGSIAFGWPGNRHSVHQEFTFDLQFKHSTWRVGIEHEYLRYGREGMHFARQSVGVIVGTVFNYKVERTKL